MNHESSPVSDAVGSDPALLPPEHLMVGDRPRPLGLEGAPRFSWMLSGTGAGLRQSAYQIEVHSARAAGPALLVWDSGRVESAGQSYIPYLGAPLLSQTAYTWRVRVWDGDGRQSDWSQLAAFDTGLDDREWEASWIRRRIVDEAEAQEQYTLARCEVTVPGTIVRARIYVASQHQHEVRFNGDVVDRGPAFSYPDEGWYQAIDATRLCRPGAPWVIGVIHHWYGTGQGRPTAEPGLLLRFVAEDSEGRTHTVVTDQSWRVHRGPWLPAPYRNDDVGDYQEIIDCRKFQDGWDRAGFDDTGWEAPEVVGLHPQAPFTHVRAWEIGLAHTNLSPVRVARLESGDAVADFGAVIAARPGVGFKHGVAGRHVRMAAGYLLDPDGSVSRTEGVQETELGYEVWQREGEQLVQTFTYLGMRYFGIENPGEELDTSSVTAVAQHADFDLQAAATFECSIGMVTRVFDLALRSALYSSQTGFVDTPTREKGQFLGDSANTSRTVIAGYRDRAFTRKALYEFADSQRRYWPAGQINAIYPNGDGQRDIPDNTALYPGWVALYYLESGDRRTLEDLYPAVAGVGTYLLTNRSNETGLICGEEGGCPDYCGGTVDWPPQGRFGYDMTVKFRTTMNVLAVDSFRSLATMAGALGRSDEAKRWEDEADRLSDTINRTLRNALGIYVDGLHGDGSQSGHTSQHASAYALGVGIVPEAETTAVADHVAATGLRMGPMTAYWLCTALGRSGRIARLIEIVTDERSPGWANTLARGATFTWETWDAADTGDSLSHGWGSTVLVAIQRYLLGVSVVSPGAERVALAPAVRELEWARGRVPTQRGHVEVAWSAGPEATQVELTVPGNVLVEVQLPADAQSPSSDVKVPEERVHWVEVGAGRWVFEGTLVEGRFAWSHRSGGR